MSSGQDDKRQQLPAVQPSDTAAHRLSTASRKVFPAIPEGARQALAIDQPSSTLRMSLRQASSSRKPIDQSPSGKATRSSNCLPSRLSCAPWAYRR